MRHKHSAEKTRQFLIDSEPTKEYVQNNVRTSKYTKLNFLPKAILIQFRRLANIYFLVTAVLQCIPVISSLSPFSAIAPFVIVIVLSIIREGIEDLPRQKSDNKVNNGIALALDKDGSFKETKWKDVHVGQILLVKDGEEFPADLLVLKSSHENGMCFIETASLDGEKNLKPKYSLPETAAYFEDQAVKNQSLYKCGLYAQSPDAFLYRFEGAFVNEQGFKIALSPKQLLLRGAKLKNIEWILGAVVYAGHDTKVMKNSERSKTKQSRVEHTMNKLIFGVLIVQLALCAAAGIGNRIWNGLYIKGHAYLPYPSNLTLEGFYTFLAYFLLTNTMIPISLIVTIEIVKFIQALFIQADEDMYSEAKEKGTKVFCSSINEELGLVDYIFSDKTGTLTSNEMIFKNFVIGKEVYGEDQTMAQSSKDFSSDANSRFFKEEHEEEEEDCAIKKITHDKLQSTLSSEVSYPINFVIKSGTGNEEFKLDTHKDLAFEFMQSVAVCHDCIVDKDKEGNLQYQGPSQDEVRLVETAADAGFKFLGGGLDQVKVDALGTVKEFKMLQSFEFTSERKRMSTLVRDGTTLKLYIKGADNVILDRMKKGVDQPFLDVVNTKLEEFSKRGYRTLVFGMKIVTEAEYKKMKEDIDDVAAAEDREDKIAKIADEFEKDIYITGCSAVEDKLQDNVPKVIHDLLAANIKVWMLTGDKLETAENIAYSCRLIRGDMHVMRCYGKSTEEVSAKLSENREAHELCLKEGRKKAFIVEGEALTHILAEPQMLETFIKIVLDCDAVVCCRAAPKQKAEMVRLVKTRTNKITLAIGDGANDVNMIQAANIGIGIYGHEGVQAVQASDFAVPEFQCVWKLILVHGRWSYIRISEMILYFFYKNMLFTLPQFYFAFLNGFSAQTFYDDYYVTTYNLIFTAFPLGVKACLEKDVDYKVRLPKRLITKDRVSVEDARIKAVTSNLYAENKAHPSFNRKTFLYWVMKGALLAVLLFVFAIYTLSTNILNSTGITSSLWVTSITVYTAIIFIVSIKLASSTRYWNIIYAGSMLVLTFVFYFAFTLAYDGFSAVNSFSTVKMNYRSALFYLYVFFFSGMELGYDFAAQFFKKQHRPSSADVLRQQQKRELQGRNKVNNDSSLSPSGRQCPKEVLEMVVVPETQKNLKTYEDIKGSPKFENVRDEERVL